MFAVYLQIVLFIILFFRIYLIQWSAIYCSFNVTALRHGTRNKIGRKSRTSTDKLNGMQLEFISKEFILRLNHYYYYNFSYLTMLKSNVLYLSNDTHFVNIMMRWCNVVHSCAHTHTTLPCRRQKFTTFNWSVVNGVRQNKCHGNYYYFRCSHSTLLHRLDADAVRQYYESSQFS